MILDRPVLEPPQDSTAKAEASCAVEDRKGFAIDLSVCEKDSRRRANELRPNSRCDMNWTTAHEKELICDYS